MCILQTYSKTISAASRKYQIHEEQASRAPKVREMRNKLNRNVMKPNFGHVFAPRKFRSACASARLIRIFTGHIQESQECYVSMRTRKTACMRGFESFWVHMSEDTFSQTFRIQKKLTVICSWLLSSLNDIDDGTFKRSRLLPS